MSSEKTLRMLLRDSGAGFVPPVRVARVYVALGRVDDAFAWLERARHTRSLTNNIYLPYDPAFSPIATDSRFIELLRSVNL